MDTQDDQIAVGWQVVEDLAMVIVLVLLSAVAGLMGGQSPAGARDGPVWAVIGQVSSDEEQLANRMVAHVRRRLGIPAS